MSIQSLKILKYKIFSKKKTLVCSLMCSNRENNDEDIFKEEESIEILKINSLFTNT